MIKNTQVVKKGEIILTIKKDLFEINLEAAKAHRARVINQIKNLKAGYYSKITQLESAKIDLAYYQKQYDRLKQLRNTNAVSQAALDEAKRQYDNASESVENIKQIIAQQLASLDGNSEMEVEKYSLYLSSKASFDKAQYDLNNIIISAPFDGIIANLYAKEGGFVSQGMPIFSLIDPNEIWIEANFKETEITNIKPDQKAIIEVDSFPSKKFEAKVIGITRATGSEFSILPAQNSSGNWIKISQRIMVRLEFLNKPSEPLSSGMSVNVKIDTKSL